MHYIVYMDMQALGVTLRTARKQRNLTQADLSDKVGMSRATLSAIENGADFQHEKYIYC